jgi:hypothetical protein
MEYIRIEQKIYKKDRQCFMCGSLIKKVVIILSPLHGFILCYGCASDLKEAIEDLGSDCD